MLAHYNEGALWAPAKYAPGMSLRRIIFTILSIKVDKSEKMSNDPKHITLEVIYHTYLHIPVVGAPRLVKKTPVIVRGMRRSTVNHGFVS